MRQGVTRMVAAGQGKRVPITGERSAEYRDLRRSLRNAMERAVAFSDSRLLTAPNGSSPDRGARFPIRVQTLSLPFLFYNFPGSNGARFQTVRTGLSATRGPSRQLFPQPSGATDVARRRVAGGTTRSLGWSAAACRWLDRWEPASPSGCLGSCAVDHPAPGARCQNVCRKTPG